MLPPPNHQTVAKLRRSWIINQHRGQHGERVRCEAAQLIYENKWLCSIDFVLGISAEVNQILAENSTINTNSTQVVAETTPTGIELGVEKEENHAETCKNCGNDLKPNDPERRKTLRPSEKYCTPACKTQLYRKNLNLKNKNL